MLALVVASSVFAIKAFADCTCGYSINTTTSGYSALFTELLETDFLHLPNITYDEIHHAGWAPQVYNTTHTKARGPYGKAAVLSNVLVNPLQSEWDWAGSGVDGGDPGLQLWVRKALVGRGGDLMVPIGEMASIETDVLYGSFRIAMKTSGEPGTCGAFFWYRNDSQEIDMEFLSRQQNVTNHPVNLVVQSPESVAQGYDAADTNDFTLYHLLFPPDQEYHEYRFDWLPDRVDFFADGILMHTITDNVPSSPGHITVNHWSNGDYGWSGGPPSQDAVLTISYIKAYFNTSSGSSGAWSPNICSAISLDERTCAVPDQMVPPNPSGRNGNDTGRTFFFSHNASQTVYTGTSAASSDGYSVLALLCALFLVSLAWHIW